jgi:hypothetical protein
MISYSLLLPFTSASSLDFRLSTQEIAPSGPRLSTRSNPL